MLFLRHPECKAFTQSNIDNEYVSNTISAVSFHFHTPIPLLFQYSCARNATGLPLHESWTSGCCHATQRSCLVMSVGNPCRVISYNINGVIGRVAAIHTIARIQPHSGPGRASCKERQHSWPTRLVEYETSVSDEPKCSKLWGGGHIISE